MNLLTTFGQIFILFTYKLYAFEVGIKRTTCSLDPADYNDPCGSLYNAICDGKHCKCPPGSYESKTLKNCQKGNPPKSSGSGGDDLFDLPFDYVPEKDKGKTPVKPKTSTTPKPEGAASGGKIPTNTNWNLYPGQPQQPGGYPQQPANNPHYPNQPAGYPNQPGVRPSQPGIYPNQPGYPSQPGGYPNQPGGYPNQPGGYPNQPGGYPNQPGGYPNQPAGYPNQPRYPNQPGGYPSQPSNKYSGGDPKIGEKAGGGIGGGIGLMILIGLIYFCCFKGGKGKNQLMNMLSKFKGGGRAATQPMPGQYGGGYAGGYGGGAGGGGYPMNQIHGQQIYTSPPEQNTTLQVAPSPEGGK